MAQGVKMLVALVATTVAAANADANCEVGLPLRGFGSNELDGDYIMFQHWYTREGGDQQLMFGVEACDATSCTKEQRVRMAGKWGIFGTVPGVHWALFAVCESGCPATEDWPRSWKESMAWTVLNNAKADLKKPFQATVTGYCCKRKPQFCDSCDDNVCHKLVKGRPPFQMNKCPGTMLSKLPGMLSNFEKKCCTETLTGPKCKCRTPETQCVHASDEEEFIL
jgi:hypothetical protein